MDLKKQKESILERGNYLLGFTSKKNYGWDIIEDVMDEQHIAQLKEWFLDAEEFVEMYGLECQKERFKSSSCIINQDERVSVERINNILSIIERIDNK